MQTEERDTYSKDEPVRGEKRGGVRSFLAGLGALVVVAALIVGSVMLFVQRGGLPGTQRQAPPPTGQWSQVLKGYTLSAPQAAPGDPSVLYMCATPLKQSDKPAPQPTVLRSADFGATWKDIGAGAHLTTCTLAVNPQNSNDVYVVDGPAVSSQQPGSVLKHTTNGGQSWATVQPSLRLPALETTQPAALQQLTCVGGRLFATALVMTNGAGDLPQARSPRITRLVMSADGGRTWTALDGSSALAQLSTRSFVVDPTNPAIIYDLLGSNQGLMHPGTEPNDPALRPFFMNSTLYKTTDGGRTWTPLLKQLPFNAVVRLASGRPNIVYVGGSFGPLPLSQQPAQDSAYPSLFGSFILRVSSDGGAHWSSAANFPQPAAAQSWFVAPDGRVYAYSSAAYRVQPLPRSTPQSGQMQPLMPPPGSTPVAVSRLSPATTPPPNTPASIYRYDPAANAWSKVTSPPTAGALLALTPSGTPSGALLWFSIVQHNQVSLYRYAAQ